jgi:hypothetical protein
MRAPRYSSLWGALTVHLLSLLCMLLLPNEYALPWVVLLFIAAAVFTVLLWGQQKWMPAFSNDLTTPTAVNRSRFFGLVGLAIAVLLVLAADLRCLAAPNETFGVAGILWLAGMGLVLSSVFPGLYSLGLSPWQGR